MLGRLVVSKRMCYRVNVRRLRRDVRLRQLIVAKVMIFSISVENRLARKEMNLRLEKLGGCELRSNGIRV